MIAKQSRRRRREDWGWIGRKWALRFVHYLIGLGGERADGMRRVINRKDQAASRGRRKDETCRKLRVIFLRSILVRATILSKMWGGKWTQFCYQAQEKWKIFNKPVSVTPVNDKQIARFTVREATWGVLPPCLLTRNLALSVLIMAWDGGRDGKW